MEKNQLCLENLHNIMNSANGDSNFLNTMMSHWFTDMTYKSSHGHNIENIQNSQDKITWQVCNNMKVILTVG